MNIKRITFLSLVSLVVSLSVIVAPSIVVAENSSTTAIKNIKSETKDALEQMRKERQNFKDAKAQEVKAKSEEVKSKIQAEKENLKKKTEDAKKKMEEKRKETLLKLVDVQIKHWGNVKERVQNMPNITGELKTQLASEIDAGVQKLNDFKVKIQTVQTKEEIQALAKEVKDFFKTKQDVVKKIVEAIHMSQAKNIESKAEERLSAIKAKIEDLKSKGKDVSELEKEITEAETKITQSAEKISGKSFKEANEKIKSAYENFKEIAKKARGL